MVRDVGVATTSGKRETTNEAHLVLNTPDVVLSNGWRTYFMRIDRAKFLILAAALTPAGCVVATHDEPVDTNPNASTGSGGSGAGDSPDAATSGAGGSEAPGGSAGMSSGGASAEDGGGPEPTADGGTSDSGAAGASGDGGRGGTGGAGGTGGSGGCDDSVGDPPTCDTTNVCGNDWAIDTCNSGLTYMKPGPAEMYAWCVQSCEDPYACMDATLLGACPDPTAATDCTTIVAGCPNIQQADCEQYLAGLTQAGRDDMVTCAASGGAFCDLYTCSESIGYW